MIQFYVSDEESAALAKDAMVDGKPIGMSGTVHDKVGYFTGIVQTVEEITPKKWRITMRDAKPATTGL